MSFFRRCLGNLCGDSQVARPLSARQEPAPGLSISVLEHHSQLDFIKETFPATSRGRSFVMYCLADGWHASRGGYGEHLV